MNIYEKTIKKPKVAHSVECWLPVTQTWLYTQIVSLPQEIESHIICDRKENFEQFPVCNLCCMEDVSGDFRFLIERLQWKVFRRRHSNFWHRTARHLRPAVWHSNFAHQAWRDRQVIEDCGAKHVVSVYGADISQDPNKPPWDKRIPEVLRQVDLVLCEGPFMAKQVIALGCPSERVKVHHLGVPLERIPFQPRRWQRGTPLRVLIVGTFREKKGITYALEALAKVASKFELEVTVIGDAAAKHGDDQEKARIMKVLDRNNMMSKTRLLGFQSYASVLEEAKRHHIFLSPSVQAADGDNEGGSPVVITEMAASGMMIVSSRHCDIPEVIPDGVAGLLADEKDIEGLVRHILWLINNPESWQLIQQSARSHIEKEYNSLIQGERLAMIYNKLLTE